MTTHDVVVVGAGPAGMAAASTAARHGCTVCLVDDNGSCGGQIWRNYDGSVKAGHPRSFTDLSQSLQSGRVDFRTRTSVVAQPVPNILRVETAGAFEDIGYRKLILATGARERFLPFPGWTLPGVMGAGGLQAMVKAGLPIRGKRVLLAGTGPLLLAVAASLAKRGAQVLGIFEQAALATLAGFCMQLLQHPGKIREGVAYRTMTMAVPFRTSSWVVRAEGENSLQSVNVSINGSIRNFDCDFLGCAFHLVPNLELPRLLSCAIQNGFVCVNRLQETSTKDICCVGELTGVGGLEKALCEGEIAGLVCAGRPASHLYRKRDRYLRFAKQLEETFALRPQLAKLAEPETFVCRCEDVSRRTLEGLHSWREAKLHTRCGMGPCQGRICGSAAEFIFGWDSEQVRPPVLPARVSTLAGAVELDPR